MSIFKKHCELSFILLAYLIGCSYLASVKPFWFDELFTLYISQTGSISQIIKLLGPMDPHPPVQYFLVLICHKLFGINEWSTRLPSILMIGVFMLCTYSIIIKYLDKSSALFSVMLVLVSVCLKYGYEARPYALILGSTALTYWLWIQARDTSKYVYVVLTGVLSGITVLTHFYAILGLFPMYLFQLFSVIKKEKQALVLLSSVGIGSSIIFTMLPILKSITILSKDNWAVPSSYHFYKGLQNYFWFLGVISFASLWDIKTTYKKIYHLLQHHIHFWVMALLAGLLVYGFLFSLLSGAFSERYVFSTMLGTLCIAAMLFYTFNRYQKAFAVITCLFIGTYLYAYDSIRLPFKEKKQLTEHLKTFEHQINKPIVFSYPVDYLGYYHYASPKLRRKLTYLLDYTKEFNYPSISGDISLHRLSQLKSDINIRDLNPFLSQEREFYLTGDTSFSYRLSDIYETYQTEDIMIGDLAFKRILTKEH